MYKVDINKRSLFIDKIGCLMNFFKDIKNKLSLNPYKQNNQADNLPVYVYPFTHIIYK